MKEPTTSPTHLIFDCDGVLVDSEVIAVEIEAELLTTAGFPITADEIAHRFVGLTYTSMLQELEVQFERPLPKELVPEIEQRVIEAFPSRLQSVPGIAAFLERSTLPRCVASSSDLDRIRNTLSLTGLDHHFEPGLVFSAQMVQRGKPEPDLFLLAAGRLGARPEECLVIEDSPFGVTAAVRAGMPVVGLVAAGHARPSLAERLRASGANHIAQTAADLDLLLS